MPSMKLNQLKKGEHAKVLGFDKDKRLYRQKLLAMGLTPGCLLSITRVAPLGDPIQISVRGFNLSLRKTEAKAIEIEKIHA